MKKITKVIFLTILLTIPYLGIAQDISTVNMVNTGGMYVANNGGASIYIPQSIRTGSQSNIIQNGKTLVGGNFYQDATTHAFATNANGIGTGTGVISFFDNPSATAHSKKRYITTSLTDISTFNRASYYVAFPIINLDTQDTMVIPGKMGIDARKLETPSTGIFLLQSTVYDGLSASDASLRLTDSGSSESLAPLGSVIVERDMTLYRPATGDAPLFAFATPFKAQRSGYFAGNWVRKLLRDNTYFDHTTYVYGNQSSDGVTIDKEQYLYDPLEKFIPNQGYLVKARPMNFDFQDLKNTGGLPITADQVAAYDQNKFVFNGSVYTLPFQKEQVFSEDVLFSKSMSQSSPLGKTVNWVIGNSYTSAVDPQKLVDLMGASTLVFEPNLYVFPAGSTTYQPHSINGSLQVLDLTDIPAMSIFMVRLDKNAKQNGSFTVGKSVSTHGSLGNNLRAAAPQYQNEVLFRITPEDNENIFDLAVVGLRKNASNTIDNQDIMKVYLANNNAFQLYSLSDENAKLAANALPEKTSSARLGLAPGNTPGRLTLHASRQESLDNVWLEDLLTHQIIDLKVNPEYHFDSKPTDKPDRFVVHFAQAPTGLEDLNEASKLAGYYAEGQVFIKGLQSADIGATLVIIDMQGRVIKEKVIDHAPETQIQVSLSDGAYIAKLTGANAKTFKFRK